MKAIWNDQIIAESEHTVVVESNHYFPAESINQTFFTSSNKTSYCPWKGTASYYSITVNGQTNLDAAWYYPSTLEKAKQIEGMVAFWQGVSVVE